MGIIEPPVYLAGACRTAIGAFNGGFAEAPATQLGAVAVRAAVERSGIAADAVQGVLLGNVLSAGLGQNPARQAAVRAGLPVSTNALTVNKVCGSGMTAVMLACQAIRCGDSSLLLAGGMENMTRSPYLLEKARGGYRLGDGALVDSLMRDGLCDAYELVAMGVFADRCGARFGFSRARQDDYAVASYRRALAASADGRFAAEIVPLEAPQGKKTATIREDESPALFNEEKLRRLNPAFGDSGTVTAGNASGISDGAACMVVASEEACRAAGCKPQARVLGYAVASREPEWFTLAPIDAISMLLRNLSLGGADVDLFEINEAFAVVPLAAMEHLGIPHERLNVNGGAVALGHPLGASGARVLVTLIHAMQQRGARIGVASLCIGGGEAVAIAVENCSS